jgi:hypothetical protein
MGTQLQVRSPSRPISRSALRNSSALIRTSQTRICPREIDDDTIRDTIDQIVHSCHSTQAFRSHPRSSRKWTPSTSGIAPKMMGMRSCCSGDQSGCDIGAHCEPRTKDRSFTRSPFRETNTAAEAVNIARFACSVCEIHQLCSPCIASVSWTHNSE